MSIEHSIRGGLRRLDIAAPEGAAPRLAAYVDLLAHWNRAYNLTAVRRPQDMVTRHILDSLSILPWLYGQRILDVGSGAGLPGIPLAVLRPDAEFTLLDSNGKRTRFMTQAVLELGLANTRVVQARVEAYRPGAPFDSVLSRAFASLAAFLAGAGRLCAPDGCLLAMKGALPEAELLELPEGYKVMGVHVLRVPDLDAERHLVRLVPERSAPVRNGSGADGAVC